MSSAAVVTGALRVKQFLQLIDFSCHLYAKVIFFFHQKIGNVILEAEGGVLVWGNARKMQLVSAKKMQGWVTWPLASTGKGQAVLVSISVSCNY